MCTLIDLPSELKKKMSKYNSPTVCYTGVKVYLKKWRLRPLVHFLYCSANKPHVRIYSVFYKAKLNIFLICESRNTIVYVCHHLMMCECFGVSAGIVELDECMQVFFFYLGHQQSFVKMKRRRFLPGIDDQSHS